MTGPRNGKQDLNCYVQKLPKVYFKPTYGWEKLHGPVKLFQGTFSFSSYFNYSHKNYQFSDFKIISGFLITSIICKSKI